MEYYLEAKPESGFIWKPYKQKLGIKGIRVTKEEFVRLIKQVVSESAIESTIGNFENRPSRRPAKDALERSARLRGVSDSEKGLMQQIVSEAVHEAVFGVLCVRDGSHSISGSGQSNNLRLTHGSGDQKTILNGIDSEFLHDIYNNA